MWDLAPVVLCRVDQLTFHAAYITYHAGVYPIDMHLQLMCSTDVVFLFATWNRIGYHRQRLKMYEGLDCQVLLCANTPEEHQELLDAGCDAIYCNHNAWLDFYTTFTLQQQQQAVEHLLPQVHIPKVQPGCNSSSALAQQQPLSLSGAVSLQYQGLSDAGDTVATRCSHCTGRQYCGSGCSGTSAACSCRAATQQAACCGCDSQCDLRRWDLVVNANSSAFKRAELADLVPNRVHISYSTGVKDPEVGPAVSAGSSAAPGWLEHCFNWSPQECSFRYLPSRDVAAVLNASRVGGIFSAEEGACYASTEYLLCGLPVASTASTGGRHVWYTPKNSVVVEATQAAVAEGVSQALLKLQTGEFDRQEIRQEAVQMAEGFRALLADAVVCISEERGAAGAGVDVKQQLLRQLSTRNKLGLV